MERSSAKLPATGRRMLRASIHAVSVCTLRWHATTLHTIAQNSTQQTGFFSSFFHFCSTWQRGASQHSFAAMPFTGYFSFFFGYWYVVHFWVWVCRRNWLVFHAFSERLCNKTTLCLRCVLMMMCLVVDWRHPASQSASQPVRSVIGNCGRKRNRWFHYNGAAYQV